MTNTDIQMLADILTRHRSVVTIRGELVECMCGWYTKRGKGAGRVHAEHQAAAIIEEQP